MSTTLQSIRNTIRNITAMDVQQLSNDALDDKIDKFYLYDFPERLKTLELEGFFRINLQPNVDRYSLDGYFSSGLPNPGIGITAIQEPTVSLDDLYFVNQPAYIDGYQINFVQDPSTFYSYWPDIKFIEQVATGNNTVGPYAFTLSSIPVEIGSVIAAAGSQSSRDNGSGGWYESGYAGSINYVTGVGTVTFPSVVANGVDINIHSYPYVASRPRDVLFYEQYLVFRPIPDQVYEFRVSTQRRPTSMPNADSAPEMIEWGDLIAYGTCLKIFIELGDWEQHGRFYPIFEEQKNLAQRRALKQLRSNRVQTDYSGITNYQNGAWPFYPQV